jgi:hypothetical protein
MPTARCESCKSSFETEETSPVCPLCGKAAEIDLSVRVLCSCGTTLKAPPKMRGRVITCPRCTRPVPIPRGNEAEEQKSTTQIGHRTRWVFALALLPLFIALQGDGDDPRRRVEKSLGKHKEEASTARTMKEQVRHIPSGRADRAALKVDSPMPWVYGAAGLALILGFVTLSFGTTKLSTVDLATGTAVLTVAGFGVGLIMNLILPARPEGESVGRLLGLAVISGAGAELLKASWVAMMRGKLPARGLLLMGLAVGAGFGAGHAIQTASGSMVGIALTRAYWIEFVTVVALQALWGGLAALFFARQSKSSVPLFTKVMIAAASPMALHAIFEFLHRKDLYLASLVVGLVSFALFHALHYWTEETEEEVVAGETIRV